MRIVAISDTHLWRPVVPPGDVLIHAGDICWKGQEDEWKGEINWLARFPHKHKIYVPGNHDRWPFDNIVKAQVYCRNRDITLAYDGVVDIDTVRFYGYAWTQNFGHTKAFMTDADTLALYANSIQECDVLISHGPPFGILDQCPFHVGDTALFERVMQYAQPSLHIFGHVHEGHGGRYKWTYTDGRSTLFANVSRVQPKLLDGSYLEVTDDPIFECEIQRTITATCIS